MKKSIYVLILVALALGPSLSAQAAMTVAQADNFNKLQDAYKISDIDLAAATPRYYGYVRFDGSWYISKETVTAGVSAYTFVKGTSAYSTAWTDRASQTYASFSSTFGG